MELEVPAVGAPTSWTTGISVAKTLAILLLAVTLLAEAVGLFGDAPRILFVAGVHNIGDVPIRQNLQGIQLSQHENVALSRT
jgi:hypothetical protein